MNLCKVRRSKTTFAHLTIRPVKCVLCLIFVLPFSQRFPTARWSLSLSHWKFAWLRQITSRYALLVSYASSDWLIPVFGSCYRKTENFPPKLHVQFYNLIKEIPNGYCVFEYCYSNTWYVLWLSNCCKTLAWFFLVFVFSPSWSEASLWFLVDDFWENCSLHRCSSRVNSFLSIVIL